MSFRPLSYNICVVKLTLCYQLMVSAHSQMLSLSTTLIGFTGCYFSWGCGDSCGSGKGWSLLRLVPNEHVFPSSCGGFWMFTLVGGQVPSSMCQHGMGSEGH